MMELKLGKNLSTLAGKPFCFEYADVFEPSFTDAGLIKDCFLFNGVNDVQLDNLVASSTTKDDKCFEKIDHCPAVFFNGDLFDAKNGFSSKSCTSSAATLTTPQTVDVMDIGAFSTMDLGIFSMEKDDSSSFLQALAQVMTDKSADCDCSPQFSPLGSPALSTSSDEFLLDEFVDMIESSAVPFPQNDCGSSSILQEFLSVVNDAKINLVSSTNVAAENAGEKKKLAEEASHLKFEQIPPVPQGDSWLQMLCDEPQNVPVSDLGYGIPDCMSTGAFTPQFNECISPIPGKCIDDDDGDDDSSKLGQKNGFLDKTYLQMPANNEDFSSEETIDIGSPGRSSDDSSSTRNHPYSRKKEVKKEKTAQQKLRKKAHNRKSAAKYRTRKKEEHSNVFTEAEELEKKNGELKTKVEDIQKEIDLLKSLMVEVVQARAKKNSEVSLEQLVSILMN